MFSNDQNIETIGQLIETLKHYAQTQGEYVKLTAVASFSSTMPT